MQLIATQAGKLLARAALSLSLLLAIPACNVMPTSRDLYLPGDKPLGLLLAHGRGKQPDWKVVEPLRYAAQQQLGYHTLSLQMPNDDINFKDYDSVFPQAYAAFNKGIARMQQLGVKKIYLMGHSMGARMASAFIATHPDAPIAGLIVAGCRNNGQEPLACDHNLQLIDLPVLDIWGEANQLDNTAANQRKYLQSDNYQQVAISDGDHLFSGVENDFIAAVIHWLRQQNGQ